ncbi:MAG: cytochrome-c peroxidase [Mariniblastus sp.]|nr:cytochrome-c peroxidase [Mariniblastus sp.]
MVLGQGSFVVKLFVLAILIDAPLHAHEPTKKVDATVKTFSRASLLGRFDRDRDNKLNAGERVVLRDAFGKMDVPMLPTTLYRYRAKQAPRHIDAAALKRMDNTPADNPLTDAGATLGRVLFYDRQLSKNNTIACASCHLQKRAFSDTLRFSLGFENGDTSRNSMSLANLRYTADRGQHPGFFWDERAPTLEEQVLMPIQDKIEMGMELKELESKLQALSYYPPLFKAAFGSSTVTRQGISKAVAQFMRSMVSLNSRFDQAAAAMETTDYAKKFDDFSKEENQGKSLFIDGLAGIAEVGCAHCHIPPTFNMPKSFNTGLDLDYKDQGLGARNIASNDPFTANNNGKFKAPSLRNIAMTAPYMHDGRFKTLEQVVEHYSSGVHPHANVGLAFDEDSIGAKRTSGFQLTQAQKGALVAFLRTLTDKTFLTDPRFSDPFVRLAKGK